MKDYNTYYHLKYSSIKQELISRFKIELMKAKRSKIGIKNSFIENILFEQKNITKEYTPNTTGAKSYQVTKNYFKELLVKEFRNMAFSFPDDLVNGFVEYVIPQKRKYHQEKYEGGEQKKYEYDPRFMYDASIEEMLDMLATYYAYQDFIDVNYPELVSDAEEPKQTAVAEAGQQGTWFEEAVNRADKNPHHPILTQEETVLLVRCLRANNFILSDRYLNKSNLAQAVHYLTGFAIEPFRKKLSNPISGYSKAKKRKLSEKLQRIIRLLDS